MLDVLVQTRRNAKAAKWFVKRLVARFGEPRAVITDKLRSYIKPIKTLALCADQRAHKGLTNTINVSHRSTRKREKIFGKFKSRRQDYRFLSAYESNNLIFRPAAINSQQPHTATPAQMPSASRPTTPLKWRHDPVFSKLHKLTPKTWKYAGDTPVSIASPLQTT